MSDDIPKTSGNGWDQFKELILFRLDQQAILLKEHIKDSDENDEDFKKEFADFKTTVISKIEVIETKLSIRAGITGGITGLLGAIAIILIYLANQP